MKIKIKTLTPVHIGTGKKLGTLEFLNYHRINYDKLFELVAEAKQDEFFNWLDQEPQLAVGDIQKKFNIKPQDIINKCGIYSFTSSFQKDLKEGIKDSSNNLFIPGSSLKGSLRTALLYKVLFKNKTFLSGFFDKLLRRISKIREEFSDNVQQIIDQNENIFNLQSLINEITNRLDSYQIKNIKKIIEDFENEGKKKGSDYSSIIKEITRKLGKLKNEMEKLKANADEELMKEIFICGVEKEKNGAIQIVYDDQKYDLLKLLKISDSTSVSTHEEGEITELQVYALNKIPPHKTFRTYTESIKENVDLEFALSIDIEFLKKAKEELNKENTEFGKKYYIGIEQKLKDLFDIDIKSDNEFSEEKIICTIKKAWIDFGEAVSKIESNWVTSILSKKSVVNINSLEKLYNTQNKFKVGFGTGFSGMTILPLLLNDAELKQKTFELFKSVGIGLHSSTNTPLNIDEFPFTRKYSNKQKVYGGFGWVTFDIEGIQTKPITEGKQNTSSIRPPNTVIAEIIDDKAKPPIVKIIEGKYINTVTMMPRVKIDTFGLTKSSRVYVELFFQNKKVQKADYKDKAE